MAVVVVVVVGNSPDPYPSALFVGVDDARGYQKDRDITHKSGLSTELSLRWEAQAP